MTHSVEGFSDDPYDLVVIGAGPAGLAGAAAAAERGLSVALRDSAPQPGGQFYRQPPAQLRAARPQALHHHWSAFQALLARLDAVAQRVDRRAEHHVWSVTSGSGVWTVHALSGPDHRRQARSLRARHVLFATGAHERQLPFPGWTLPGVVGAGGAQAMLKAGLVLPGRRVVVAGSGPLLLAVASSLVKAGARVPLVAEASGYAGYARAPRTLAANPGKLAEGARHASVLLRHGVRVRSRTAVVAAHGTDRVEAVTLARLDAEWRPVPGTERRIACDGLAVGHGLVPQLEVPLELGCRTTRLPDGSAALVVDASQRTSVPGLWAAGETTGVGGVQLAIVEGELAGRAVAGEIAAGRTTAGRTTAGRTTAGRAAAERATVGQAAAGRAPAGRTAEGRPTAVRTDPPPTPAEQPAVARPLLRRRARLRAFADLLARVHAPGAGWTRWLDDATEVCRCEEVTVRQVREAVTELGAGDQRTVKLLTRAGMGWCQARMCGPAVARLCGATDEVATDEGAADDDAADDGAPTRPLSTPVPLGLLAESCSSPLTAPTSEGVDR